MYSRLLRALQKIQTVLLDVLFPESCVGCGTQSIALCSSCRKKVIFISGSREEPWIYPTASYTDPMVRCAITRAKYKRRPEALISFAPECFSILLEITTEELSLNKRPWILIPIPTTKERERARGYNQAALLVKAIIKEDTHTLFSISETTLRRKPETQSQVSTQSKAERLRNPHGTFFVKDTEVVQDAQVVLIDDVLTTGATLREARKTLLKAGAKEVRALTLAYTEKY